MINWNESRWTEMKEDKQRQKLASWLKLHWHFDHWALYSGLEMDHLSISSFRRLTCSPHKKRQFGVSVGPRVWVFYFVSWIWHRCPDITKHLTSASATIFGPCHLILIAEVRQLFWERVPEQYWPNKLTFGASILQEKANWPSFLYEYCFTVTIFHSRVQQLTEIGLHSWRALKVAQSCGKNSNCIGQWPQDCDRWCPWKVLLLTCD